MRPIPPAAHRPASPILCPSWPACCPADIVRDGVVVRAWAQAKWVTIYKESIETKLGVTFYRRDPQEGSGDNSAIISRLTGVGPAAGVLAIGDRILQVAGCDVDGPLTAAGRRC